MKAETVRDLRSRTGCGLMECQRALDKSEGDVLLAEGYLRYNGLAIHVKKEGMSPSEAYNEWVWDRAREWKESQQREGNE